MRSRLVVVGGGVQKAAAAAAAAASAATGSSIAASGICPRRPITSRRISGGRRGGGFFSTVSVGGKVSLDDSSSTDALEPPHVAEIVHNYRQRPQVSVSLQTLLRTGKGELLEESDLAKNEKRKKDPPLGSLQRQASSSPLLVHPHNGSVHNNNNNEHAVSEQILIQVARFLQKELPTRLAHRIWDLHHVPWLRDMPSVRAVKEIYIQSLLELLQHEEEIQTPHQEGVFGQRLQQLYHDKHSHVLIQMARGAYELRQAYAVVQPQPGGDTSLDPCHDFLNRFYLSRIGIRVLAGHYLALRQTPSSAAAGGGGVVGLICPTTSPHDIVQQAVQDATYMCQRTFDGEAPTVQIVGRLDLTFSYVPTHLHYILLELLKNAMRATMEQYRKQEGHHPTTQWHKKQSSSSSSHDTIPPIVVIIADSDSNEDVVIKVSDEGGGIPRSHMKKIWSYLFTTADASVQDELLMGAGDHSVDAPLAGLGFGLPISRSYARYFGGDLSIMSMEGYGTDAFVHLRRLGDSTEPLP